MAPMKDGMIGNEEVDDQAQLVKEQTSAEKEAKQLQQCEVDEAVAHVRQRMRAAAFTFVGKDWDLLFKRMDPGNSGHVSWPEFFHACRTTLRLVDCRGALRRVFDMLDSDGNGYLDPDELVAFIEAAPSNVSNQQDAKAKAKERRFQALLRSSMTAHKSELATIRREFYHTLRTHIKAAAHERGGANWSKLFHEGDRDHSGTLTEAEFCRLCRHVLRLSESEHSFKSVFRLVDKECSGACDVQELIDFVDGGDCAWTGNQTKEETSGDADIMRAIANRVIEEKAARREAIIRKTYNKMENAAGSSGKALVEIFKMAETSGSDEAMLSFVEFTIFCRTHLRITVPMHDLRKVFSAVDKDYSGECSIQEMCVFMEEMAQKPKYDPTLERPKLDRIAMWK